MNRNLKHIGGVAILLAIPLFIGLTTPDITAKPTLCPILRLYGVPCPGCGLTKSVIFLYQGDIVASIGFHVLGIVIVAILFLMLLLAIIDWIGNYSLFDKFSELTFLWQIITLGFIIQYVVRLYSIMNHS